jgi:hypothetical protein
MDFDSYGQCKDSHGKGNPREIGCFPIQMYAAATVEPRYCIIRLFLFGWMKTQVGRREYNRDDGLYEVMNEILIDLSIKMIETVFAD